MHTCKNLSLSVPLLLYLFFSLSLSLFFLFVSVVSMNMPYCHFLTEEIAKNTLSRTCSDLIESITKSPTTRSLVSYLLAPICLHQHYSPFSCSMSSPPLLLTRIKYKAFKAPFLLLCVHKRQAKRR